MRDTLQNINKVEGVIGSLVSTLDGEKTVHAFPPLFDGEHIRKIATTIAGTIRQSADTLELLEMRYQEGKIVTRILRGGFLTILCTSDINMSLLTISLNVAKPKLEILLAESAAISVNPDVARNLMERMDKLKIAFIRQVGPVGEYLFEESIKKLGTAALKDDDDLVDLVDLLKDEIESTVGKTEFINESIAILS
jgi:predicted regulator of Ras-like GTPase activity (Roadblock/LC7/MglB family)